MTDLPLHSLPWRLSILHAFPGASNSTGCLALCPGRSKLDREFRALLRLLVQTALCLTSSLRCDGACTGAGCALAPQVHRQAGPSPLLKSVP